MSFTELMHEADRLLGKRALLETCTALENIIDSASLSDDDSQVAYQKLGNAYRASGRYREALDALQESARFTKDKVTLATVARDKSMVTLEILDLHSSLPEGIHATDISLLRTLEDLRLSYLGLQDKSDAVELAASLGSYGRGLLVMGRRDEAFLTIRSAQKILSDKSLENHNPAYELDNLIWLARSSAWLRFKHAPRALKLATDMPEPAKLNEYLVILLFGERAYKALKRKTSGRM